MMSTWSRLCRLRRVFQRADDLVALGGVVVDQVGDPSAPGRRALDQMEAGRRVLAQPFAERLHDLARLP